MIGDDHRLTAGYLARHIPPGSKLGLDIAVLDIDFQPRENRGRWTIKVRSEFGDPAIGIKLDVGPPCWLAPEERPFVKTPAQSRYGFVPPAVPVMRLEEILAEKVARLTRVATARDASDLVWASSTSPHSGFSRQLVLRLAVLKVWVDNNGLGDAWRPALSPRAFDPEAWLAPRGRWDDEQIGLLAHPPPALADLQRDLARYYGWIRDLTEEEKRWALAHPHSRGDVIAAIRSIEGGTLQDTHLY